MKLASLFHKLLAFAAVGAVGTAAHYALLVTLVSGFGAAPVLGSMAGFCLGALVNYTLNRKHVFKSERAHREALPRFMLVALSGLLWNTLLMTALTRYTPLHYLLAQMLTTGLLLLWHFGANAVWTFRGAPDSGH